MEFGNENVRVRMEDDRISSLPDEIIHRLMSFNDTKYAVQTSVLSPRWKLLWTTLPYLKFSTDEFRIHTKFSKFLNRVLSRRNNCTEVYSLDLYFRGSANMKFIQKIGNYAVSHNIQKVNIFAYKQKDKNDSPLPLCFFSSKSLKHLRVTTHPLRRFPLPQSPWDSPALTTVELYDLYLCPKDPTCLDLFSKCVSLMNLTLSNCYTTRIQVMEIQCPRLVRLTISDCTHYKYKILAPNLSSLYYKGAQPMLFSTSGLKSLEKVNLHMRINCSTLNNEELQRKADVVMNMLHKLRYARFVTLHGSVFEFLSKVLDLVEHQPSPFCNLKCLIWKGRCSGCVPKSDLISQVMNYLLNSSPTATVTMKLLPDS